MSSAADVYNLIASSDTSGIDEFTTLFAYEGFNPEMVHAHFAKMISDKGISQDEFVKDVRALITLGALKGNYTMKNAAKISDAGKIKADGLYKKYELKQGSLKGDKKAIILPRVLSAFPDLTTKVILKVAPRDFGTLTSNYPKFMKNPVFPALIPKTLPPAVVNTLLWLFTVYSAEQSLVISQETDLEAAYDNQKKYIETAFNSTVPQEPTRIAMFKQQLDEIVQTINRNKDMKAGKPPKDKVDAPAARSAINSL